MAADRYREQAEGDRRAAAGAGAGPALILEALPLILGGFNLVLGAILILGDPQRTSGPSFATLTSQAPAAAWGCFFMASGWAAVLGQGLRHRLAVIGGHYLGAFGCLLLTLGFLDAALRAPTASLTGVAAYSCLGVMHGVAAGTAGRWIRRV